MKIIDMLFKKISARQTTLTDEEDLHHQRDFSFKSGERQIAKDLKDIRYDHRLRYELAVSEIRNTFKNSKLLGLDIFSGNGYGTSILSEIKDSFILGIEGSAEAVDFSNQYYNHHNTMYCHKLFPFYLPEKTFDFVVCFESLEHIEQDDLLLKLLCSSLKDDGLLFLSFPNEELLPFNPQFHGFHYRHYRHDQFINQMKANSSMKLLKWYGQDTYAMEGDKVSGEIEQASMTLDMNKKAQFQLYEFTKNASGNDF